MSDNNTAKLLLTYVGKTTTASIIIKLMQEFARIKNVEFKAVENICVSKQDIEWSSCVIVIRGADCYLAEIIKAAKKAGRFCVFYIDDDLLALYGQRDIYGTYIKKCVSYSDVLWTSNRNVAQKYSPFLDSRSRSVESVVLEPWSHVFPYKDSDKGVGIIYAGSPAHEGNIKKFILPALRNVYQKHSDIRVFLIGYDDTELNGVEPYIKTTKWFDNAEDYRKYVAEINAQIGIAVIDDSAFGKCKFYNKYIEYSKLGLAGLYTNCEPYTFVVKDNLNGLLASNTVEDWTKKLLYLIENPQIRKKCAYNAQSDLLMHYNTQVIIDEIDGKMPEFTSPSHSDNCFFYNARMIRAVDWFNKCVRYVLCPDYIVDRFKRIYTSFGT